MEVGDVASQVGLWWPEADEDGLRAAAAAWERMAAGLDEAVVVGRAGVAQARGRWQGEAAQRFEHAWRAQEQGLHDDAAGARALAGALVQYADAVADAKRRVEELAITAGATIVAGVGLAWLTFGTSAAAAAGVSAALVSAAAAIGVELSATVATILGGALVGVAFGAVESAVVDRAVAQPLRVEAFGDGDYSLAQTARAAAIGGAFGGVLGGATVGVRALARPGVAPPGPGAATRSGSGGSVADDLGALDSRISAALDPSFRGTLGPLFRAGVHETPAAAFGPTRLPTARLLEAEGASVHARVDGAALVRESAVDPGRLTELLVPEHTTVAGLEDEILEAGGRLARQGGGDLVLDGRTVDLDLDAAGEALAGAAERAAAPGLAMPAAIRFVFDDGFTVHYP